MGVPKADRPCGVCGHPLSIHNLYPNKENWCAAHNGPNRCLCMKYRARRLPIVVDEVAELTRDVREGFTTNEKTTTNEDADLSSSG